MKKYLVLVLTGIMMLSLVACGGSSVPTGKLSQVDTLLAKMEVLSEDMVKEVEKCNNTGYDDVQAYYVEAKASLEYLMNALTETRTTWEANKNNLSEEQVDEAIKALMDLEKQCQDLKQQAIDEVAGINDLIAEVESIPESVLSYLDAYEVPEDLSLTGWQLVGGIADGEELTQAEYDEMKSALGGECVIIFDEGGVAHYQIGDKVITGEYGVVEDKSGVVISLPSADTIYYCVFTVIDNETILIAFTDETAQSGGYYRQVSEG